MRHVLALAALAAIVTGVPAHALPISGTGATAGLTDPSWSVMWRGLLPDATSFGALANAPLVTAIPSPPWQPNSPGVNNWLGASSSGSIPGGVIAGGRRYEYAFTTSFDVAIAQWVTSAIGFDNFFVGGFIDGSFDSATGTYTPGMQVLSPTSLLGPGNEDRAGFCRDGDGALPSDAYPGCTVDFAFLLPAGSHTITFVLQGDGITDGFFLRQPTPVPEPASIVLLAVGLGALAYRRRSARSTQGK